MDKLTPLAILLAGAFISGTQYYIYVDSNNKKEIVRIENEKKEEDRKNKQKIKPEKSNLEKDIETLIILREEVNKKVLLLKNESSGVRTAWKIEEQNIKDINEKNKKKFAKTNEDKNISDKILMDELGDLFRKYSKLMNEKDSEYYIAYGTLQAIDKEIKELKELEKKINEFTK